MIKKDYMSESDEILDKPSQLNLIEIVSRISGQIRKTWKAGLGIILLAGMIYSIIHPSNSTTNFSAETTLYIPPYTSRIRDNKRYTISNNLGQIDNMIELIQTKLYQDSIREELNGQNLNSIGSYSVSRVHDTDLISIECMSNSAENAERLCNAVVKVMTDQIGRAVRINDMVSVDSVKTYSRITTTTLFHSFVKGASYGLIGYAVLIIYLNSKDKRIHSKEEAEEVLGIPVLSVFPYIQEKKA